MIKYTPIEIVQRIHPKRTTAIQTRRASTLQMSLSWLMDPNMMPGSCNSGITASTLALQLALQGQVPASYSPRSGDNLVSRLDI